MHLSKKEEAGYYPQMFRSSARRRAGYRTISSVDAYQSDEDIKFAKGMLFEELVLGVLTK